MTTDSSRAGSLLQGLFGIIVGAAGILLLLIRFGVDQFTDVRVWSKPLTRVIVAAVVLISVTFYCSWIKKAPQYDERSRNLLGLLVGSLVTAVPTAMITIGFLEIIAQRLPGRPVMMLATVTSIKTLAGRSVCKQRLSVLLESGDRVYICTITPFRAPLASANLEPGMAVKVHLNATPLGDIVKSVAPDQ